MLMLSTLYQIEKTEEFIDELSQRDERSKRIGRREKYFQNKCALVSSQNHRIEKSRGRHCRGVSPTFSQLAVSHLGRTGSVFHGSLHTFSGKAP